MGAEMDWEPTDEMTDGQYAICPLCGCQHGDCFEWLTDEMCPVKFTCRDCGAQLEGSVSYDVSYSTTVVTPPTNRSEGGGDG